MTNQHCWGIVPAAGIGARLQADRPKQYLKVNNRYILDYSISALSQSVQIQSVVVSLDADDAYWQRTEASQNAKVMSCVGGQHRTQSVLNALIHIQSQVKQDDWVLVHDASRPCLSTRDIDKLLALETDPVGGILAVPITDSVKEADDKQCVRRTVEHRDLWRAMTPQMFRYGLVFNALKDIVDKGDNVEDEASAMSLSGHSVQLIEGEATNIKLTYPDDLAFIQHYLGTVTF